MRERFGFPIGVKYAEMHRIISPISGREPISQQEPRERVRQPPSLIRVAFQEPPYSVVAPLAAVIGRPIVVEHGDLFEPLDIHLSVETRRVNVADIHPSVIGIDESGSAEV